MKSIMHKKTDRTCYLCMRLNDDHSTHGILQEHHVIFGTANRKLSERYGLKVYLCLPHHLTSPAAVHNNLETRIFLEKEAQKAFEKNNPDKSFLAIFGMNRLDEEDRKEATEKGGQYDQGMPGVFPALQSSDEEPKDL